MESTNISSKNIQNKTVQDLNTISRKQMIEEAESMLRITEKKVDLISSRNTIAEAFQRSLYGEEINEPC